MLNLPIQKKLFLLASLILFAYLCTLLKSERGETTFTMSGDVIKDNYGRVYIRKDTLTPDTATTNLSAEIERLRPQVAELKADKAELQQTITTLRKALEKYI